MTMTLPPDQRRLLPCPFCGAAPKVRTEFSDERLPAIWCSNLDCFGPHTTAQSVEDASVQWNKRVSAPRGWKLVPVKMTDVMRRAVERAAFSYPLAYERHYRAALDAAPPQIAEEREAKS